MNKKIQEMQKEKFQIDKNIIFLDKNEEVPRDLFNSFLETIQRNLSIIARHTEGFSRDYIIKLWAEDPFFGNAYQEYRTASLYLDATFDYLDQQTFRVDNKLVKINYDAYKELFFLELISKD